MTQTVTFHDLKGASVFITGGGSGIGAALSEGFVAQGAKVAFVQDQMRIILPQSSPKNMIMRLYSYPVISQM